MPARWGGHLYVPAGTWYAPDGGFKIRRSMEFFGDGPLATLLPPHSGTAASQPVLVIDASDGTVSYVHMHDFQVGNDAAPTSRLIGSHGIACNTTAASKVTELRFESVLAYQLGDNGFHLDGANTGAGAIVFVHGVGMEATLCQGSGFFINFSTCVEMHNSYANRNQLFGAFCQFSQVAWHASAFEGNCLYQGDAQAIPDDPTSIYDSTWGAPLRFKGCTPARVDACDFEEFTFIDVLMGTTRTSATAIVLETCYGGLVSNCAFYGVVGGGEVEDSYPYIAGVGVYVSSDGWATVLPCRFIDIATPVQVALGAGPTSVHSQEVEVASRSSNQSAMTNVAGLSIPVVTSGERVQLGAADGQLVVDSSVPALMMSFGGVWYTITTLQ